MQLLILLLLSLQIRLILEEYFNPRVKILIAQIPIEMTRFHSWNFAKKR